MTLSANIIGAGKLGKSLLHLFVKNQLLCVQGVHNQTETSSNHAIQFIGQGTYCPTIHALPPADITFITTPDDKISHIAEQLSKNPNLKKDSIVLHCSGALTSDILAEVKEKGCHISSVHPMRSFASSQLSTAQYEGTFCAIEGDAKAIPSLLFLFEAIGSITYEINKNKKSLYHAAGVFASNYLITIANQAITCMKEAGVEQDLSIQVTTNILRNTIDNLEKTRAPEKALTGPIQRGDVSTIMKHMESLTRLEAKKLYAVLGIATLNLTNHSKEKKEALETALDKQGN